MSPLFSISHTKYCLDDVSRSNVNNSTETIYYTTLPQQHHRIQLWEDYLIIFPPVTERKCIPEHSFNARPHSNTQEKNYLVNAINDSKPAVSLLKSYGFLWFIINPIEHV